METKTIRQKSQLTPRQLQLLKAVCDFELSQCYSPTIAELASQFGTSRSTVFEHIAELRKKGMLLAQAGKARSLSLTSKAQKLLKGLAGQSKGRNLQNDEAGIPLVGTVAAGEPIEAIENRDCLSLSSYFAYGDQTFALEVKGDSMIDDGICDGDVVICRRSEVADNGQMVVAIVDDENATLKRFYKEKTRARLQPANENYAPIYSDNCRIEAVVVGLVRRF